MLLIMSLAVLTAVGLSGAKVLPERWVYVPSALSTDEELARVESIARTASEHGLNGMLLSAGFDELDLKPPEYFRRLVSLKKTCSELGVEIVPIGFSVGYGGGILAHNKNLAAGLPVRGALFVARDGEARFQADPPVAIKNGGFETLAGNLPANFTTHGSVAVIDTEVAHAGKASVRFEQFSGPEGEVHLAQDVRVHPYRCYRLRCWVKTLDARPAVAIHLRAIAPDGRDLSYMEPPLPATSDWHEVVWGFNSWYADRVQFQVGVSEGKTGKVWVDDVEIEEVGLTNILRRPGTPLEVRNEETGEAYEENRDFAPVTDPQLNFRSDHEGPAIKLLPGSRIHTGDRLRVDYFHGKTIYRDQVPADMSEPEVYEIWRRQIPILEKYLSPKKYFLSMDEVRVGGFCQTCKKRHLSMAQIVGDCVARQKRMIRAVNPKAEIYVWSDMFDPNHNARAKYYLIDGGFVDTWKYLPKDFVIACWYYEKRDLSLPFFSRLGYRTLGAAYYDADDLENPRGWLESLERTPNAVGIMYTTWQNKYELLPAFGELVSSN